MDREGDPVTHLADYDQCGAFFLKDVATAARRAWTQGVAWPSDVGRARALREAE